MDDTPETLADLDAAQWSKISERVTDYATRVLTGLPERPTLPTIASAAPEPLPRSGIGAIEGLARFDARYASAMTGSAGPRYLGFVTGGTTPAALVGDWLTGVFDQNAGPGGAGTAAAAVEREAVAWLRQLLDLGDDHSGAFVSGATMSNLVGLAIGREWLADRVGVTLSDDGAHALGPVRVLSGSPHSSIHKALSILGMGRSALRHVATLPRREAVDVDALAIALRETAGGTTPPIVVANAGTVNTGDSDDLAAIAALKRDHDFWLHVDGAFGAFAALAPDTAKLVTGLDAADSVCVDLHKWLNVPYDSAIQFTRRPDLQRRVFRNDAAYLRDAGGEPDFAHLTPETSRRLRALAAWFTLTAYGADGHRVVVERGLAGARELHARLVADRRVRTLAPPRLNIVCFTLADDPTSARLTAWIDAVNEGGTTFVTPTELHGVPAARAAFSNWRTTVDDASRAGEAILAALDTIAPNDA
ncbi:pyridoxal phosphate-dependent decarboxylase family protein [Stackebrandtia soli]|uniref:pyridoxal phosphate-dependent decarboxylase family protein n=1 Tax=Stackebrandtia soli TaxID=1892856 RepID=UPI0039EBAB59